MKPSKPVPLGDSQPRAACSSVPALMAGLRFHALDAVLHLDGPVTLSWLASTTVRGLCGYALDLTDPGVAARWFKPGHGNHVPAPYVFQPLWELLEAGNWNGDPRRPRSQAVPFRVITWDPRGELVPALAAAMERNARGREFGATGARVEAVEAGPVTPIAFHAPSLGPLEVARLEFQTPLCLKAYVRGPGSRKRSGARTKRALGPREISLGHVVVSLVRRLQTVSHYFGHDARLDEDSLLCQAALVPVHASRLRSHRSHRHSEVQDRAIYLQGVQGHLELGVLPADLVRLFQAGALVHAGRFTNVGCGKLALKPPTEVHES